MRSLAEVSYADFGSRLARVGSGARTPLSGSIEITFKCNLRCLHCYIPDYSGKGEMSTAELIRILDEIAEEGCLWLLLTGGEVLCRSDFRDIYLHAKRRGFLVTIFSNGTLLDEGVADLLAEHPPFGIEFTLYGLSDETYLKTTGSPGRFSKVRRAIDLLVDRKVPLSLKAVAMEPLADEIPAMEAFAASRGLRFRYDAIVHGRLDGSMAPTAVRAEPRRVVEFDSEDPDRLAEWLRYYRQFVKPTRPSPYLLSCGAGVNSFHIDPKGTLLSCEALPLNGYDLRRGTFREGWNGIIGALRHRLASEQNVCAPCELKALCDRCPATATLETGSPDGWIPYYCEITHRRAAMLEEARGDAPTAARYREHADRVAGGWTPPGAILPRASRMTALGGGCAAGGCSGGGCGVVAQRPTVSEAQRLQIDVPGTTPLTAKEVVR